MSDICMTEFQIWTPESVVLEKCPFALRRDGE